MFQLIVLAVFAIGLFDSPFGVQAEGVIQTRETVFQCYSWGDPHIQTWHPKDGTQIRKRDCYAHGDHFLLKNKYVNFHVHVNNKLTIEVNLKFHDGHTKEVCHIHIKRNNRTMGDHNCEAHGITWDITTVGSHSSYNIKYPEAQFLTSIRENGNCPNSCYYNIYVWQPQYLVDESTGICGAADLGCTLKQAEADEVEWAPVRSVSARQVISNEQATTICNEYVDTFLAKIGRSQYQRDARLNSIVTNVLAGCVDDLVLTGQVEMAEGSVDVLMMQELTEGAASVDSIETALHSGLAAASVVLDDAVKVARVGARRIL